MRSRLWASDTFVDFDHSLNTAVNKVREALGDAASNPRFVQTIARRGYRFIAPIQADGTWSDTSAPRVARTEQPPAHALVHPDLEVPVPHRGLTRGLFMLIQIMYLTFYLAALFRWQGVHRIGDEFMPGWGPSAILTAVLVTGGIGIPLRCYLISGAAFDHQRLGVKFRQLFPAILALDELWAIAPFLLSEKIGFGAAFAATAGLLYLPFSERSLVRLAYPEFQK